MKMVKAADEIQNKTGKQINRKNKNKNKMKK